MNYFQPSEFVRCKPSCSIEQMDGAFLRLLNAAREVAGVPFVLLSAYRSSEWDKMKGRSGTGMHTQGRAVDIKCVDGVSRYLIVRACLQFGLSVGIYSNFLHIDYRPNKVIFYGK